MSIATALLADNEASPELAAEAVGQALAYAGLTHAQGVLLFLTTHFARHAGGALTAASRAANCLQVAGGVVAGVANERSWVFDRPAAVALVLGGPLRLSLATGQHGSRLAVAGASTLPPGWATTPPRFGLLHNDALSTQPTPAWTQGRLATPGAIEVGFEGITAHIGVSTGVRPLGEALPIEAADGSVLARIGGHSAADSLRRSLPAEYRTGLPLPLHLLAALPVAEGRGPRHPPRLIPIAAVNPDGSLTLGEPVGEGQLLRWAIRQPIAAEADMRQTAAALRATCGERLAFALYASCIGRGPYFYGGDDRDWVAIRDSIGGAPFVGIYGSGQIAPYGHSNHLLQNSVVLSLFETTSED